MDGSKRDSILENYHCTCIPVQSDQNYGHKVRLVFPDCKIHGKEYAVVTDLSLNHEICLNDESPWMRVTFLRRLSNGEVMVGFDGNGIVYVLLGGWMINARKRKIPAKTTNIPGKVEI